MCGASVESVETSDFPRRGKDCGIGWYSCHSWNKRIGNWVLCKDGCKDLPLYSFTFITQNIISILLYSNLVSYIANSLHLATKILYQNKYSSDAANWSSILPYHSLHTTCKIFLRFLFLQILNCAWRLYLTSHWKLRTPSSNFWFWKQDSLSGLNSFQQELPLIV